jgi:hypothetical protein
VDAAHGEAEERAVVTYPAPHGVDAVTLRDGDCVTFGRGADCDVRFGYAPLADRGVPRRAGSLIAANRRIFVESAAEPGHRALTLREPEGSVFQLGVGEGHAPRSSRFEVLVPGETTVWKLAVTVRAPGASAAVAEHADLPTHRHQLELTDTQRRVLDAYAEPIRHGRMEPATHREVGAALHYHPNTVREVVYEVWAAMFAAQIPMPDVSDKRVAVVEAARTHGLLTVVP